MYNDNKKLTEDIKLLLERIHFPLHFLRRLASSESDFVCSFQFFLLASLAHNKVKYTMPTEKYISPKAIHFMSHDLISENIIIVFL